MYFFENALLILVFLTILFRMQQSDKELSQSTKQLEISLSIRNFETFIKHNEILKEHITELLNKHKKNEESCMDIEINLALLYVSLFDNTADNFSSYYMSTKKYSYFPKKFDSYMIYHFPTEITAAHLVLERLKSTHGITLRETHPEKASFSACHLGHHEKLCKIAYAESCADFITDLHALLKENFQLPECLPYDY